MNWLRLIRYKNLLIVFLTQLLVWYCLMYDSRSFRGLAQLYLFLPLACSTLLIAAAGYIINDYFDIKIDVINRPEKVILEKKISLKAAIIAHAVLNTLAFGIVAYIACLAHHYEWLSVQITSIVLLWFYSTHFKKQFITGNLVVAVLTALSIMVLQVYEPAITSHVHKTLPPVTTSESGIKPLWVLMGYAFFAFMLTWIREIVKDMEDYKGDAAEGCMTMPIKMGLQFSAQFVRVVGLVTLLTLCIIFYFLLIYSFMYLAAYILLFIALPLGIWLAYLPGNTTQEHYHKASRWLKIIMLSGICSLIVYHFSNI